MGNYYNFQGLRLRSQPDGKKNVKRIKPFYCEKENQNKCSKKLKQFKRTAEEIQKEVQANKSIR